MTKEDGRGAKRLTPPPKRGAKSEDGWKEGTSVQRRNQNDTTWNKNDSTKGGKNDHGKKADWGKHKKGYDDSRGGQQRDVLWHRCGQPGHDAKCRPQSRVGAVDEVSLSGSAADSSGIQVWQVVERRAWILEVESAESVRRKVLP